MGHRRMKKEFLPKIKSIKTRHRIAKVKSILKNIWSLFPLAWIINLLAKIFVVGAVVHYLDSIGSLTILINIILILWVLMSFKSMLYDFYYSFKEILYNKQLGKLAKQKREGK